MLDEQPLCNMQLPFYVKHRQGSDFCWVKVTFNSNTNNGAVSNSAMKVLGKLLRILESYRFSSVSSQLTIVVPWIDITTIFWMSRIK